MTGLIEPINSRITDPRYYLDSPHQGTTPRHSSLVRNNAALDFSEKTRRPKHTTVHSHMQDIRCSHGNVDPSELKHAVLLHWENH